MHTGKQIARVLSAALALAGCGGGGGGGAPAAQSSSYQTGYAAGQSGPAHSFLAQTGSGSNGNDLAADSACDTAFGAATILDSSLDEGDYKKGCHAALTDHPVKADPVTVP